MAQPACANHLLGGEMTYRYLDAQGPAAAPLRYEITITVYDNCGHAAIRDAANVGIYDQATGNRIILTSSNYPYTTITLSDPPYMQTGMMSIPQTSISECLAPVVPPGCIIRGVSQPYQLQKFIGVVNLPSSTKGYYAVFTDGTRNADITNLTDPANQALTLYTAMAPQRIPNRSPVFSDVAVALICAHDTTFLLNNAVDADGDRLVYSFGRPYGSTGARRELPTATFTPPPYLLSYNPGAGYASTTPLGTDAGNLASLDAATGIARYASTQVGGKFVVAVDVSEYRTINGQEVLIGTTRRDLQLIVASCPVTKTPVLPPVAVTPRNYTIEAGSTLRVPITATQADGNPLTMTLNSVLLDGPGGYNATLDGQPGTVAPGSLTGVATTAGANGSVTGTLVFTAGCGDARATPYDVALTVKDTGCAGKTVADVLHITVTKPSGPTAISGDLLVCGPNSVHSYTASGGTASKLSWRAEGGTIVGSNTTNPVQVNWNATGTGTLVARGLTNYGCLIDSVVQRVAIGQTPTFTVLGNLTICQGSSTTLTPTGSSSYTVAGGPSTLTGAGPFTVSPTQTTTYTITAATTTGCPASTQVTVTVLPLPAANVGAATHTVCSGAPVTLGAPAVSGSTYSWSPAMGLSSSTSATPTVTLTNTSGAPITQTYTLTETNTATGCANSGTVVVTVNQAIKPGTIGADQTLCLGTTAAVLTSTTAASGGTGPYTYQWESSVDNGTWASIAGATSATYAPGAPALTYYYRRWVTAGACGPAVSNVVAVQVQAPVVPSVTLATPPAQCAGTAITFTPAPTNAGPAPTYRWFVNNVLAATTPTFTSSTLASGDQVRVELTPTAGSCASGQAAATSTVTLTPVTLPTVTIRTTTTLPACSTTPVMFSLDQAANVGANPQYQWQVDGTNVAGAQGTTFTSTSLRDGQTVTLALRSATACNQVTVTSNAVRVGISPLVDVDAGPDKEIDEGGQVELEGRANGNYPVTWTPSASLSFASGNQLRPVASPTVTTTYTLSAGTGDCFDQSSVTVTVTPLVRIPNALSPNGDGLDDTWQITHIGDYPSNHVLVFNRWGSKIFEASNYSRSNEWNGTISGQPAPVGTYYYVITLGNGKSYSGPLTVVY